MKKNTIKDPKAIKYFKQSFQNGQLGLLFTGIDAIFILSTLKYYIYLQNKLQTKIYQNVNVTV